MKGGMHYFLLVAAVVWSKWQRQACTDLLCNSLGTCFLSMKWQLCAPVDWAMRLVYNDCADADPCSRVHAQSVWWNTEMSNVCLRRVLPASCPVHELRSRQQRHHSGSTKSRQRLVTMSSAETSDTLPPARLPVRPPAAKLHRRQ